MERICEPELMGGTEQAQAYAAADFSLSDQAFIDRLEELLGPDLGPWIIDLGCGPGNISFPLARRHHRCRVLGLDGSAAMLAIARGRLEAEPALSDRLSFQQLTLPCAPSDTLEDGAFAAVVSNSLLHHLHNPQVLWATAARLAAPGAVLYVKDLRRPSDRPALEALVQTHAAEAPAVLRHDYALSLQAAFTPDEVREQLHRAGLGTLRVNPVGDRHLEVWGRLNEA